MSSMRHRGMTTYCY